jgi:excisionase family DNA binding protein
VSAPVYSHSFKSFAEAVGLHKRTVVAMVERGEIRCVRFGSTKKPIVRLEEPSAFLERQGRYSDPQPEPAL